MPEIESKWPCVHTPSMFSVPTFLGSLCGQGLLTALICGTMFITGANVPDDDYAPQYEGDEWLMEITFTGADGAKATSANRRIAGKMVERDGKQWREMNVRSEGEKDARVTTFLERKDKVGVYSIKSGKEVLEFFQPIRIGKEWLKGNLKCKVVGRETIKIGDKTYEGCYRIRGEVPDGYWEETWHAPSVGMVRFESGFAGTQNFGVAVLKEFKPGKR